MNEAEMMEQDRQEQQAAGRTFTQSEVEELIQRRLARDRRTRPADAGIQSREAELADRELKLAAKEKLLEAGLPISLAEYLRYEDEKALQAAIEEIGRLKEPGQKWPETWGDTLGVDERLPQDPIKKAMGLFPANYGPEGR